MSDSQKPEADPKPTEETQFPGLKDDAAPTEPVTPTVEPKTITPKTITFAEQIAPQELEPVEVSRRSLKAQSRRDFLIYGAGAVLTTFGFVWLLPDDTRGRLKLKPVAATGRKAALLDKTLRFDDGAAKLLYSKNRLVPTYSLTQATTEPRNNYGGQTPGEDYIPGWKLTVAGLASGQTETFTAADIQKLIAGQGGRHDQVTRLCCVEGWSMVAAWGGLRFADFLKAYPPIPDAKWARLDSSVNLDGDGDPDPYYVSVDLPTAEHPQSLLATHQIDENRQWIPLTVEHGAPLRLIVPMKLGLKNIKAITKITYMVEEPPDYWSSEGRGYSYYDGL